MSHEIYLSLVYGRISGEEAGRWDSESGITWYIRPGTLITLGAVARLENLVP